jgi:hypothetical protein
MSDTYVEAMTIEQIQVAINWLEKNQQTAEGHGEYALADNLGDKISGLRKVLAAKNSSK